MAHGGPRYIPTPHSHLSSNKLIYLKKIHEWKVLFLPETFKFKSPSSEGRPQGKDIGNTEKRDTEPSRLGLCIGGPRGAYRNKTSNIIYVIQ